MVCYVGLVCGTFLGSEGGTHLTNRKSLGNFVL